MRFALLALIVISCAALLGTGTTIGVVDYFAGELLLAEEMERRYTKPQILELYLNTINYGNGAYGAEAAAQTYFQVHASDLTWGQASFLAGLPQAPSDYNTFGTPDQVDAAKGRWRQVL